MRQEGLDIACAQQVQHKDTLVLVQELVEVLAEAWPRCCTRASDLNSCIQGLDALLFPVYRHGTTHLRERIHEILCD